MAWIRLDNAFTEHPKVVGLPDAAFRLHIHAMCYAHRMQTDGLVPRAWLTGSAGRRPPKAVTALVDAGLWEASGDDYRIHDYLEYQQSRADILTKRQQAAERMKRSSERRANNARTSREVQEITRQDNTKTTTTAPPSAPPPLVKRRNLSAAFEHPRFDVPQSWHDRRVSALSDGEAGMLRFYKHLASYIEAHSDEDTEPRFEWLSGHFDTWVRARKGAEKSDVRGVEETRRLLGVQ